MLDDLKKELVKESSLKRAAILQRFFKTGEGEYGQGDLFLGLTVPRSREFAKKYQALSLKDLSQLIKGRFHEERLIALLILISKFSKADEDTKKEIYEFYLSHTRYINNWDLVDLSADKIVGGYLIDQPRAILLKLAKSQDIWERRIAIMATFQFIKEKKEDEWTFKISEILINDKHDLIQKAVGWMLREVGKRINQKTEEEFLQKYYKQMPRTMLRYAIERFPENLRLQYLKGTI